MLGLAAKLVGGAVTPLIDQASAVSARLLRKLALFVVAGLSLVVVLIALTVAFDLWVSSFKGPIVGALAVAGLYFAVAVVALAVALWPRPKPKVTAREQAAAAAQENRNEQVDDFAAPLLKALQGLGLRREQLAVLAGASVAKQVGPVPLVGLAIVAGFLVGRMWKGLFSNDLIATILASDLFVNLFGTKREPEGEPAEERDAA